MSHASSVACASTSCGNVERAFQSGATKDLRRLHRPQLRAIQRLAHHVIVACALDGVGDRCSGDRGIHALTACGSERVFDQLDGQQRPSGVVDEHHIGVASSAAASARRTDSERTAPPSTPRVPSGACTPGGKATTIRSIAGDLAQRLEAPGNQRLARQLDERLGTGGPEALAASGGENQRNSQALLLGDGHLAGG